MNKNANSHEEINKILIAVNRYYFGLSPVLKSKLLPRRSKTKLYKILISIITFNTYKKWDNTKMD